MRIGIMILLLLAASLFSQGTDYFTKCVKHGGIYVAIGRNKTGTYVNYYFLKTSKDSVTWVTQDMSIGISDVRWLGDRFVVPCFSKVLCSMDGIVWSESYVRDYAICVWGTQGYGRPATNLDVRIIASAGGNKYVMRFPYQWVDGIICNMTDGWYYGYYYSDDSCRYWNQYDGADWSSANNAVEKSVLPAKAAMAKATATYDIRGRRVSGMTRPGIYFVTDGIITKKVFNPY